jgi:hypothetical protein
MTSKTSDMDAVDGLPDPVVRYLPDASDDWEPVPGPLIDRRMTTYTIRLARGDVERLRRVASVAGEPATAVMRRWVLDRLALEERGDANSTTSTLPGTQRSDTELAEQLTAAIGEATAMIERLQRTTARRIRDLERSQSEAARNAAAVTGRGNKKAARAATGAGRADKTSARTRVTSPRQG